MLRLQAPLPDRYTLATPDELDSWIATAKAELGERLLILGHHYQRDEVIKWADARGDSFKLARFAADDDRATDIVFCGVHFMAESADVLTGDHQRVILPDLNAGCSMADMADIDQVEECWDALADVTDVDQVVPITYMNSSAALKAFVGEHGGAVCTSSNARAVLEWALGKGDKVLFFPDQHLGRNTGFDMGYDEQDMRLWNPRIGARRARRPRREGSDAPAVAGPLLRAPALPPRARGRRSGQQYPGGQVVVHPECAHDVVRARRPRRLHRAHPRLASSGAAPGHRHRRRHRDPHGAAHGAEHPDQTVVSLDPLVCPCSTMFRIDGPHLAWVLESLVAGEVVNRITRRPAHRGVGTGGAAAHARHHLIPHGGRVRARR